MPVPLAALRRRAPRGHGHRPLVTFDCFDTVITRAVGSPEAVAWFTGRRLREQGVLDVDPEVFLSTRREAEWRLIQRRADRHDLTDVATEQARMLGLSEDLVPLLVEAELATELAVTRPVPLARRRAQEARTAGARVGFLSDTCFPISFVDQLLRTNGVREDGDDLWVSNDLGAGKGRGTAYFAVGRQLGAAATDWRHYGDDPRADIRFARLSGVRPTHLTSGRTNRYERLLEGSRSATGGLASLLAGASRRTRLVLEAEQPAMPKARAAVVAGVAGPLLTGYLLWCFRQAQRAGVKRMYFLSRDGEVLLAMARRLAAGLGLDLDLRYLEGSRRAWLLASMPEVDVEQVAAVVGRGESPTVRTALSWLDVTPEGVQDALAAVGYPPQRWDEVLDTSQTRQVLGILEDPEVAELVRRAGDERAEVLRDHLDDAGLLDSEPFALVDLDWQGTVGRVLTGILGRFGAPGPATECYFGLELPRHEAPGRDPHGYMFDNWNETGVIKGEKEIYVVMEMFTAATHGRVDGYERVDGTVRPVLTRPRNDEALAWGLMDVRHGLDVFCDELVGLLPWVDPYADVRRPTWAALLKFWKHPTAAEVEAWGGFPFEDDDVSHPIGHGGYSTGQVLRSIARGAPRMQRTGSWPAAAHHNAPRHLRLLRRGGDRARKAYRKAVRLRGFLEERRAQGR